MRKFILLISLFLLIPSTCFGVTTSLVLNPYTNKFDFTVASGGIEISDIDDIDLTGLADGYVLKYDTATNTWKPATDDGGAGSGDNITVNGVAVDTTGNIKDSTDITWTLTDGGAGGPDNITGEVIAQGDTGNIQYNNADALTAAAGLNWDNANTALQVRGEIDVKTAGKTLTRIQALPYAEDSVWLAFDMAFDGSDWKSSDAGSNYAVAKVGDQLRFYGDGGITVGDNASLEILGLVDYTGYWNFYNVIMTGHDGLDGGVWIYSEQGGTDYTLKLLPNAAMTSDALFYFPVDEPAADSLLFVSTAGIMTYKVIGTDVQAYDADLADLADGELTASKVGGVKDADYGEITVSGGSWTVDDSVAVTSWNLTTPTITTSLTTDGKTISEAEIGILDGGIEGTEILSTGEAGGTKFLREDGDGTSSWQALAFTNNTNISGVRHRWHISIVDPNTVVTASSIIPICALTDAALTVTKIVVTTSSASYEAAGDLKYADARISLANATVINAFDTSSGVLSDDTITSGSVGSGKCVYLSFDSAPNASMTDMVIDVYWDYD